METVESLANPYGLAAAALKMMKLPRRIRNPPAARVWGDWQSAWTRGFSEACGGTRFSLRPSSL